MNDFEGLKKTVENLIIESTIARCERTVYRDLLFELLHSSEQKDGKATRLQIEVADTLNREIALQLDRLEGMVSTHLLPSVSFRTILWA